ncbi:aspartate aminotransferase family protein [Acetobacter sp. AN02]|uniref:pyridoxal phosphate-dependent decarboxylase family protein n=1 Tax=Acetobacter sp. AN02 TaxID=2894186 RepID=UPI00243439A7|nr:aspartate aminotransferase family protein [Acetobacter sp. AN02]MDG6094643.1 aspartate aminotransferase family protein [Acetobacter sp. AN02]
MLDDMFDSVMSLRDGPVWQSLPDEIRSEIRTQPCPEQGHDPKELYSRFTSHILPYAVGNRHPGFMGWVHGGGTLQGMLAEMLAAGLNANLGGRDQAPVELERTVLRWTAQMAGLPEDSSGVLVTGSSMANFIAILTATRAVSNGADIRRSGLNGRPLTGYAAVTAHGCISRGFDMAGLGTEALRLIPADENFRMDTQKLRAAIREDRAAGREPFMLTGSAGTVDTGSIDPLNELADIAKEENLWFHVDGAFGALARLSPDLAPMLAGIERADSLALDFHKWGQVPYDAGCIIIRDAIQHRATFAQNLAYLSRETRGLAAGSPWFCDFGPDLSRGFRALKVWMTLATFGTERLGQMVSGCCAVARHLADRIRQEPELELLAPVTLNIVCFRVRAPDALSDELNSELVRDIQESGVAAPSATTINGRRAIRCAIVNHRTTEADTDRFMDALLKRAGERSAR